MWKLIYCIEIKRDLISFSRFSMKFLNPIKSGEAKTNRKALRSVARAVIIVFRTFTCSVITRCSFGPLTHTQVFAFTT